MPAHWTEGDGRADGTSHERDGEAGGRRETLAPDWGTIFGEVDPVVGEVLGRFPLQEADRDDCRQRIWEEVLATRLAHYRGGNLRAWFATLARNKAIDVLRRRHNVRASPNFEVASDGPGGDADASEAPVDQARIMVWRALAELDGRSDPRSFLVFYLHWIEGWPIHKAGEILGLLPCQARLRHHRLKKRFRELVGPLAG